MGAQIFALERTPLFFLCFSARHFKSRFSAEQVYFFVFDFGLN